MTQIIFFHCPMTRSSSIHWLLEELGAPHEKKIVDITKGQSREPDYLKINPMGKVPAIVADGTLVTESGAIITYLCDLFPKAGLAPKLDDAKRGAYLRWMFFGAGCVEPAALDKAMKRDDPNKTGAGYGNFDSVLGVLRDALSKSPYILGDKFMGCDLYIGGQIRWLLQFGLFPKEAPFTDYAARVSERPAYKRAMEADAAQKAKMA